MIGVTIRQNRLAWGSLSPRGSWEINDSGSELPSFLKIIKDFPDQPVCICSLSDVVGLGRNLEKQLAAEGRKLYRISPGDALGQAFIDSQKEPKDSALVYFDDIFCGALIFRGQVFSCKQPADSIGRMTFLVSPNGADTVKQPVAVQDILTRDRIEKAYEKATQKKQPLTAILREFAASKNPSDHPFRFFYECLLYTVSNINYSFDPAEIVYSGELFDGLTQEEFEALFQKPVTQKITGDSPTITFTRFSANQDDFLRGTCLLPTDSA